MKNSNFVFTLISADLVLFLKSTFSSITKTSYITYWK